MPRKGRFLEILVERLESFLSVEGVTVKSPEIFFKNGKIIGEIDITLRGNFGSSKIFIGVECRDRPADGLQGIDWIRNIYGKQEQLGVDKMIAVSSTGFTEDAIELATKWKIDLLVLTQDDIGQGRLEKWLKVAEIPMIVPKISFNGRVEIITQDAFIRSSNLPYSSIYLQRPGTEILLPIHEFLDPEVKAKSDEFFSLNLDTWDFEINMEGPFRAGAVGKSFSVDRIRAPIRYRREITNFKMIINAYKRLNDGEIVAMSGVAQVNFANEEYKLIALQKSNNGEIEVNISFVSMDDKPFNPKMGGLYIEHPETGALHEMTPRRRLTQ